MFSRALARGRSLTGLYQDASASLARPLAARQMSSFEEKFGALRYDDAAMRATLDDATYQAVNAAVASGEAVPADVADKMANAIRAWAEERGAVNYTHIFYPLRAMKSGQKKDAFINLDFGDSKPLKDVVSDFSGSQLFMSETDGSSFPNGGLRVTHTAAAYMCADRTSPPYVMGDTLYIPSAFMTWNGHAIDHKTGLLRSQEAITKEATRLLNNIGFDDVKEVYANVGCEQEFFVIPRELVVDRPDLMNTGRTVLGAAPPRGQQLSDHYFGKIHPRVKVFFEELQQAMWDSGISMVVYHNEVAPGQHELSPIFALTNVAADQNILTTELMQDISLKHGFVALNHEKPFAGINGSGKHCNWGLNSDTGMNLYTPGKTKETQSSFAAFTAALMHGFANFPEALRASVATSGNDHRLGADEAPPAIFSIYLGEKLGAHFDAIAEGGQLHGYTGGRYGDKIIDTGARSLGPLGGALEDRNRTAPIPFCGNRFEFRAVGSNQNISLPMTVLNAAVADGCAVISDLIEGGASVEAAVQQVVKENAKVVFNGNGYGSEWHHEAEFERGLPNLKDTPEAWGVWNSDKNKELFAKHKIFSGEEVDALKSVNLQRYSDDLEIEADTMINMVNQGVLPAAAADLKAYDGTPLAGERSAVYGALAEANSKLTAAREAWPTDDEAAAAKYASATIKPAMDAVRAAHDKAENLIDRNLYPYPTYYDMLFPHQEEQ